MPQTTVNKIYDDTIGAGLSVTHDVAVDSYSQLGILSVMDDAASAGDVGVVTVKMYDGDRPRKLVDNLPLNSSYTLGPTLVGAVSQKWVVYNVGPFVEVQISVNNAAAVTRNLEVFVYRFQA